MLYILINILFHTIKTPTLCKGCRIKEAQLYFLELNGFICFKTIPMISGTLWPKDLVFDQ